MKKLQKKNTRVKRGLEANISSKNRIEALLLEAEEELAAIQPKIEKLEKQLEKLTELKLAKQKLITLRLSLKSILSNFDNARTATSITMGSDLKTLVSEAEIKSIETSNKTSEVLSGTFLPDQAFQEADKILKKKGSINYELFRAVVFSGGKANTEQIRAYLAENGITRPGSGEPFDQAPLTEISSRINYLVRRGVVVPSNRGEFVSVFGWSER